MKKFPVVFLQLLVKMIYAASAIISSFLDPLMDSSPPSRFFTAAVEIEVLGHKAFTPTYSLNSPAIPLKFQLLLYY
jgi:hypothetical protein